MWCYSLKLFMNYSLAQCLQCCDASKYDFWFSMSMMPMMPMIHDRYTTLITTCNHIAIVIGINPAIEMHRLLRRVLSKMPWYFNGLSPYSNYYENYYRKTNLGLITINTIYTIFFHFFLSFFETFLIQMILGAIIMIMLYVTIVMGLVAIGWH